MKKDNTKLDYLNIGCGNRFHSSWMNIDMVSNHPDVTECNILNGLPFPNNTFEVVYHSHVLEHFRQQDGKVFIEECFRILKPGGSIRIAVPDLEKITRTYLQKLEGAYSGNAQEALDYQWIMLELYDQTVRGVSGGEMKAYLKQAVIPNEEFVYSQVGYEARNLRRHLLSEQNRTDFKWKVKALKNRFEDLFNGFAFFRNYRLGKFRNSGEIHYWMYDRYSLSKLLKEVGFTDIQIQQSTTSSIPDWNTYELDAQNGLTHKPDSLFIEAKKPDMNVLLLNSLDSRGGAARACQRLAEALGKEGLTVNMLSSEGNASQAYLKHLEKPRLLKWIHSRFDKYLLKFKRLSPKDDFSTGLLGYDLSSHPLVKAADIIHLHWINRSFLSMQSIKQLSSLGKPVVWTMHDMWPFTGGCHYNMGCNHFKANCGQCPILNQNTTMI